MSTDTRERSVTANGITTYDTRAAEILLRNEDNWIGFFPDGDDMYTRVDSEGECVSVTRNLTWIDCLVQAVGAYTGQPIDDIKPEIDHLLSELDAALPQGLANTVLFSEQQTAELEELRGIAMDLAAMGPVLTDIFPDDGTIAVDGCAFCNKQLIHPDSSRNHADTCVWRRAKAWQNAYGGAKCLISML